MRDMTIQLKSIMVFSFLLLMVLPARGQREKPMNLLPARVENGDTTVILNLETVTVFPPLDFENKRERRKFFKLVRRVKKVYPYARLAGIEFQKVEARLDTLDSYRKRREVAKKVEKKIKKRYGEELKKLNFSEGTILIKLIDRETAQTSYRILKEMRGRLMAGFWQGLGRLFGYNLKEPYDPEGKDKDIETIVLMIEAGVL